MTGGQDQVEQGQEEGARGRVGATENKVEKIIFIS